MLQWKYGIMALGLLDLPAEVVQQVVQCCDVATLGALACTCSQLRREADRVTSLSFGPWVADIHQAALLRLAQRWGRLGAGRLQVKAAAAVLHPPPPGRPPLLQQRGLSLGLDADTLLTNAAALADWSGRPLDLQMRHLVVECLANSPAPPGRAAEQSVRPQSVSVWGRVPTYRGELVSPPSTFWHREVWAALGSNPQAPPTPRVLGLSLMVSEKGNHAAALREIAHALLMGALMPLWQEQRFRQMVVHLGALQAATLREPLQQLVAHLNVDHLAVTQLQSITLFHPPLGRGLLLPGLGTVHARASCTHLWVTPAGLVLLPTPDWGWGCWPLGPEGSMLLVADPAAPCPPRTHTQQFVHLVRSACAARSRDFLEAEARPLVASGLLRPEEPWVVESVARAAALGLTWPLQQCASLDPLRAGAEGPGCRLLLLRSLLNISMSAQGRHSATDASLGRALHLLLALPGSARELSDAVRKDQWRALLWGGRPASARALMQGGLDPSPALVESPPRGWTASESTVALAEEALACARAPPPRLVRRLGMLRARVGIVKRRSSRLNHRGPAKTARQ